ncbi:pseudouridine synthase [Paradesertivirga mongoliensis]|uniref:Pseudouridine synthase n=1 Tax=Paradesertivirga mongoliensis TaxID=2100740 RepID=A0ABW4ZJ33_9SPHI|nr:pseudouridine synthase [Pedobacter mongoliensis]
MPEKKNRNSREDKSLSNNRLSGSSKNERPDNSNNFKKKKFEDDSKRPYKSRSDKPEGKDSEEKKYSRSTEDKSFSKKPFNSSKEKPFGKSDRSFEKKSFGSDRPKADRKTSGERSFEKKPLGERSFEKRPRSSEGKSFDKPREERSFERRPARSGDERRLRPDGDRSFEKKPFREGDKLPYKSGSGLPYERKPFKSKNETRKWTSEEKIDQPATRGRKKTSSPSGDELIRLNRYIANAGICSRRKADELIEAGVISVNGEVVSELGFKVNPVKDIVRYNGETLKREKMTYVLLNKPKDYITTTDDPQERKTVMQLVEKASRERIYPVGRLDRNTTGLLLMTNDGDLAEKLSHPRNNITKIYQVELNKNLSQGDFNKIEYGLELEDGLIKPDALSYVQGASKKEIGIQIHTGKNRIVRRIFEFLGYEVVKLDRVVYGSLTKKDLPRGRWRYLEEKEIIQLKHLIK